MYTRERKSRAWKVGTMQQDQGKSQHDQGKVTFHCKDVMQGCPWEVSGKDEREVMPKIKEHGRTSHNVNSFVKSTED
jgi:predicted small metal-binding protein